MIVNYKQIVYWSVGAIGLIALAGYSPDLATLLVVIIIAGVVLAHTGDYLSYLNVPSIQKKG